MTVKKCDKCGAIYENGYLLEYRMHENCGVETIPCEGRYSTVDLCDKCKEDFNKWLSSQPKE
jgi:hypothetical protein